MPKAFAYIRWSTAAQQAGDSETRQLSELGHFESATRIPIVKKYRDDGRSAYRGDNSRQGELKTLLQDIDAGHIRPGDYLVVESIDRITRQRVIDGVQLLKDILKKGIRLYTTTDHKTYSLDDPSEDLQTLLLISVIAQRAHEESSMKSKRLLSSWEKRRGDAEEGRIIIKKGKSIPYGLRVCDGKFVIQEDEQKEIQALFEMLLLTGITTAVQKINKTSKKTWSNGTVVKMIENRTVIGYMSKHTFIHLPDGKTKKVLNGHIAKYYPELIEPSLFYSALAAMKERKKNYYNGRRAKQDFNIFKNMIFCAGCGGKLYYNHRGSRYKDMIYPSFRCDTNRLNPALCSADNVRFEHVFGLFLTALRNAEKAAGEFSTLPGLSAEPIRFLRALAPLNQVSVDPAKLVQKQSELAEYESKLDNLTRSLEAFDFAIPQAITKKLSELEQRIDKLQREIASLSVEIQLADIDLESRESIVSLFKDEEGRQKLNSFFKSQAITFHVVYSKAGRLGEMNITSGTDTEPKRVASARVKFPQKEILKGYGLPSLQEMFGLTVND